MANFQLNLNSALVESTEFNIRGLYLHQVFGGDDPNQVIILDPKNVPFGLTVVNNWAIKDGAGKDANIVAHAKGLHMNAIQWYNSFVIVFETERFKESTLLVMGATLPEVNDWGIVGGTGEFSMARGVIKRRVHEKINGRSEIQEFTIHGFCAKKSFPTPTKIEPAWGGNRGSVQDITAKPRRLESITIHSGFVIDSFAFSYIDQDGESRAAGPWGGSGGQIETIKLGPAEFVKEISGTVGEIDSRTVISSLKFITNLKTYGPFGRGQSKKFSYSVPENKSVVAFFGRSDKYLDAIGVHTA